MNTAVRAPLSPPSLCVSFAFILGLFCFILGLFAYVAHKQPHLCALRVPLRFSRRFRAFCPPPPPLLLACSRFLIGFLSTRTIPRGAVQGVFFFSLFSFSDRQDCSTPGPGGLGYRSCFFLFYFSLSGRISQQLHYSSRAARVRRRHVLRRAFSKVLSIVTLLSLVKFNHELWRASSKDLSVVTLLSLVCTRALT